MNREEFLGILNSKVVDIRVFKQAALVMEKSLSSELEDFIRLAIKNPLYNHYIIDRYQHCMEILIKHFSINSVKELQSNSVIKFY